jgi:hypothetical protein
MNTDTPTEADEELRTKAIQYVNKVCSSHPLAYTDRDALDALLSLINSEVRQVLDRLEKQAVEQYTHSGSFKYVSVQTIEKERKRYE